VAKRAGCDEGSNQKEELGCSHKCEQTTPAPQRRGGLWNVAVEGVPAQPPC
jgi:hypothetical protein